VRRIIYVAGNHDAAVLGEHIKQARRAVRVTALRNTFGEVRLGLDGTFRLESHGPQAGRPCRARAWLAWLNEPRIRAALEEILRGRDGRVFLSHGFPEAGVAFKRSGPRDTPQEQPQWFLDESLRERADATGHLLRLLADRRQRLDRVIQADWGSQVEIVRHFAEPARGLHFEHGHAAIPACNEGSVGRWVSAAAGLLKRCGLRQIEHWVEEDLGERLRAVYPFASIRESRLLAERLVAVGTAWRALDPRRPPPLLVCGHTHENAQAGLGPVSDFLNRACGARYANSGAWSCRFRLRRPGANRGEWLVIGANNAVAVRATAPEGSAARPAPAPPAQEHAGLFALENAAPGPTRQEQTSLTAGTAASGRRGVPARRG
jgi:UDP-2,3-diacylglucosamine pyrophosphatase LpxH